MRCSVLPAYLFAVHSLFLSLMNKPRNRCINCEPTLKRGAWERKEESQEENERNGKESSEGKKAAQEGMDDVKTWKEI